MKAAPVPRPRQLVPRLRQLAPRPRHLALVLLTVAALVLLPLLFALLAPPALAAGDGPVLSSASRDLSTAALDRIERLLNGEFTVRLAAVTSAIAPAVTVTAATCAATDGARPTASRAEPRSRPSETERAL